MNPWHDHIKKPQVTNTNTNINRDLTSDISCPTFRTWMTMDGSAISNYLQKQKIKINISILVIILVFKIWTLTKILVQNFSAQQLIDTQILINKLVITLISKVWTLKFLWSASAHQSSSTRWNLQNQSESPWSWQKLHFIVSPNYGGSAWFFNLTVLPNMHKRALTIKP